MAETTLKLIVPPAELPIPENGYLFGSLKANLEQHHLNKRLIQYTSDSKSRRYLMDLGGHYTAVQKETMQLFWVEDDWSSNHSSYRNQIDTRKEQIQALELEFYAHAATRVTQLELLEDKIRAILLKPREQFDGMLCLRFLKAIELCNQELMKLFSYDCQCANQWHWPYSTYGPDVFFLGLDDFEIHGKTISKICQEYEDEQQQYGRCGTKSAEVTTPISDAMNLILPLVCDRFKSVDELMLNLRSFADEDISGLPRPAQRCFEHGLHDELRSLALHHYESVYFMESDWPDDDGRHSAPTFDWVPRFFDTERYTSTWLDECSFSDSISGPPSYEFQWAHSNFSLISFEDCTSAFRSNVPTEEVEEEQASDAEEPLKQLTGKSKKIAEQAKKAEDLQQRIAIHKADVARSIIGLTKAWVWLKS